MERLQGVQGLGLWLRAGLHLGLLSPIGRSVSHLSVLVTSLIVFPRRRYKDGVPVARHTPDPRLRNRRCKDGVPAVRHTPDPRPLVFPRRRCHAVECGSFQMRQHHILHCHMHIFNVACAIPIICQMHLVHSMHKAFFGLTMIFQLTRYLDNSRLH